MAFSRDLLVCLLILLVVRVAESHAEAVGSMERISHRPALNCNGACAARCRLSSRHNLCRRACGTCCYRCGCVPPGTSGNKNVCPCYAKMTTSGGKPKCP